MATLIYEDPNVLTIDMINKAVENAVKVSGVDRWWTGFDYSNRPVTKGNTIRDISRPDREYSTHPDGCM